MAKQFRGGDRTGWHQHERAQLIFAVEGLMVAEAEHGTWAVPSGHALWVPAGMRHNVTMRGAVSMRTIYVEEGAFDDLDRQCRVIMVTPLLEALLVALSLEPKDYDRHGRGGHLVALAIDEIRRAPAAPFALAIPEDPRLRKLAEALVENPGAVLTIDHWADAIGVSRRTLTRLFRAQTGLSFAAWRRRLRLMEAVARQADGEALGKIAASLGYRSLEAFKTMAIREFGQILGRAGARRRVGSLARPADQRR